MNPKLIILVLMISALLVGCNMPAPVADNVPGGPEAWIDAPLPDSHLPLAPYSVISHADSPNGIDSFELSINGQVYSTESVDPAQAGQTLANHTQPWVPAAPGTYLLSVRALDTAGKWGPSAEAQVTVGELNNLPTVPAPPTKAPQVQPTAVQDTKGPAIREPNAQPNPNGLPRTCRRVPPTVVTVQIKDPSGVQKASLHVTYRNQEQVIGMTDANGDGIFSGKWDVPKDANGGDAAFFIEASDTLGNVSTGGKGTISLSRTVCP